MAKRCLPIIGMLRADFVAQRNEVGVQNGSATAGIGNTVEIKGKAITDIAPGMKFVSLLQQARHMPGPAARLQDVDPLQGLL